MKSHSIQAFVNAHRCGTMLFRCAIWLFCISTWSQPSPNCLVRAVTDQLLPGRYWQVNPLNRGNPCIYFIFKPLHDPRSQRHASEAIYRSSRIPGVYRDWRDCRQQNEYPEIAEPDRLTWISSSLVLEPWLAGEIAQPDYLHTEIYRESY